MAGPFTVTGTINGVNATFTIAFPVSDEQVYSAGIHLAPTQYTITNTSTTCTILVTDANAIPQTNDSFLVYGTPALASTASTTSKTGFSTAGTLINRVAVQCGLAAVTDPYASTDANFVQLREFLNMVGEDLQNNHEWGHFIREATITTASSATSYTLPSDFYRLVDQSEWNRSTRLPLIGPLSGQGVQYLKARLSGVLVQVGYRLQGNLLTFAIAPPNGQTLAFEYVSNYWVWSAAGSAPDSVSAVATGDTVLYDADLTMAGLRLLWLEAKGFDTTTAQRRYDAILESAISKNVGAKVLNMGGSGVNADHLIDASNLPVTGYAQ